MDRPADAAVRSAVRRRIVDHRRAQPPRQRASPATASSRPRSPHSRRDPLEQAPRSDQHDGEARPRRPRGSRSSAAHSASPSRSSVISHRRGQGLAGRHGATYSARDERRRNPPRHRPRRNRPRRQARAARSGRGHPGRGVEAPLGRGDRGADRGRPARLRRKPGPGGAGQMAGAARALTPTSGST